MEVAGQSARVVLAPWRRPTRFAQKSKQVPLRRWRVQAQRQPNGRVDMTAPSSSSSDARSLNPAARSIKEVKSPGPAVQEVAVASRAMKLMMAPLIQWASLGACQSRRRTSRSASSSSIRTRVVGSTAAGLAREIKTAFALSDRLASALSMAVKIAGMDPWLTP